MYILISIEQFTQLVDKVCMSCLIVGEKLVL